MRGFGGILANFRSTHVWVLSSRLRRDALSTCSGARCPGGWLQEEVRLRAPPMNEIERALTAHPDVTDAVICAEESADGRPFKVAFAAVAPDRLSAGKSKHLQAETDRRVTQWRRAFDQVYRHGPDSVAPSFVGWTSNFTNKPIPETEMIDWLDCTIERIRSLGARRILEVGCGVGLLVERLAPGCEVYCGTDLSPVAVHRLRAFAQSKAELRHVKFLEREATDSSGLSPQSFDAVVINSVVQYFPGIEYLHRVLEQAVKLVAPGGHIFVGDVRNLELLPVFHREVQSAKAPSGVTPASLERKIMLAIAQDRELVIHPEYFKGIPEFIPQISGAEIQLKRGSSYELTRYRYDAVLRVDPEAASARGKSRDLAPQTEPWIRAGRALATDPMAAAFLQQLGMELSDALRGQFRQETLPAAVIALSQRDFAAIMPAPSIVPDDAANHERVEA
ncbi:class I SAM-dependent methyltransferase [Bradyrhizobium sp. CCBAU 45384]|uniref:class I SAM-dependent methyltransferase n=1 Tax=Bradyrhizobium sp. CCBAU 45384 TaxID=858428 RepID=UPI0023069996|nr:methyltransferase [Bradyrhizobium sp. CCBAU 45384]